MTTGKKSPSHGDDPSPASSPPLDEEKGKALQDLRWQVQKLTDLAARAQADLQNSKARMEREAEDLRKFAMVPLLLALLPVRDDLVRAAAEEKADGALRHILAKLDRVLSQVGLKPLEALGESVDPTKHEIVNTGPGEKDMITLVHEEGYELHGKVLRPAKVQVGDGEMSS